MRNKQPAIFDIKLLQLFDVLYSVRSVTRAAEQLDQSQPTISIWLNKLRRQFKDPLFVRTSEGMQPTPQADALIGPARETLQSMRKLSEWEPEFDPLTAQRKFRICMTDASHNTLLPQLLAHIRTVAPHVQLEAAGIDARTPRALQYGEADLALGLIPDLNAGFYQQTLFTQDWVCLSQVRHPRVGKKLTRSAYKSEGHINIVSGTGQQLLEQALKVEGIERRVVLDLPGFLGLSGVLATTDLIATLPRHIGETLANLANLKVHRCPFPIPSFTVKQYWHTRYHRDASSRWLRGVCVHLFLKS
jgi:DNA-binding transcriptional LysR family regulator